MDGYVELFIFLVGVWALCRIVETIQDWMGLYDDIRLAESMDQECWNNKPMGRYYRGTEKGLNDWRRMMVNKYS